MKLCDYGLMAIPTDSKEEQKTTIMHKAPESIKGEMECKSDVWSLGILLIELGEGKNPFEDMDVYHMKNCICYSDPPSLSRDKYSPELVDFVEKCLVKDVKKRASVSELMDVRDGESD